MKVKERTLVLILLFMLMGLSCAHKSTFQIAGDGKQANVFQYCGGQQWGYIQKIDALKGEPYLAVYIESQLSEKRDFVVLNVALQSLEDLEVSFKDRIIQIRTDQNIVYNKASSFWILRNEKTISERYSSDDYSYSSVRGENNQWLVRKKKYGGFFGEMALEEPFLVTISRFPNEEINSDKIFVKLDQETMSSLYVINKIVIPFGSQRPASSVISVVIPEFEVNGKTVRSESYQFHYDREKLVQRIKDVSRCASLNEIFRWGRNQGTFLGWIDPKVSN